MITCEDPETDCQLNNGRAGCKRKTPENNSSPVPTASNNSENTFSENNATNSASVAQYATMGAFVNVCKCEIHEKVCTEPLIIKEATTGYSDQDTGTFVTYVIEFGTTKMRRRYSDFELLAAHLNRVYPHQVIPPIPEKETLTSIISGYTGLKGRHDPFLIQHRTRLFQSFLMNVRGNVCLRGDHYFHRLIDASLVGSAWSEGITAVPARLEIQGTATGGAEVNMKGKVPDPMAVRLEAMTEKYREGLKAIEKGQSKLLKRLKDESNVLSELGASFNAFSLELDDSVATNQGEERNSTNQETQTGISANGKTSFKAQLEMIGQSSDSEAIHCHALIRHHELLRDRLQEMILYCGSIHRTLNNLIYKRASLENFHDQINTRKNVLMQMESNVRADDQANDNLQKLRKKIEELENDKKLKLNEMNDFSSFLLKDIDRTFAYFGETWRESLKALAGCQSHWHEEAIKSWKIE